MQTARPRTIRPQDPMNVRVLGHDVEITGSFWFSAILIGLLAGGGSPGIMVVWTLVLLVSVLVHELGHALAFRLHKVPSSIRLHFMGGVTVPDVVLPLSRGALVFVFLAGPFAGFALAGVAFALLTFGPVDHYGFRLTLASLFQANLFWSVLNLAPVLPLDGGHVLEHALGPKRYRITLIVSGIAGALLALWFGSNGMFWGAYIFGSSAFQSFMRLRDVSDAIATSAEARRVARATEEPASELTELEQRTLRSARRKLDDDDPEGALSELRPLVDHALGTRPSSRAVAEALSITAWAHLSRGDVDGATSSLARLSRFQSPDLALVGSVAFARGDVRAARNSLEAARAAGDVRKEVFGPLIQVLLRDGEPARAAALALDSIDSLSSSDARTLAGIVRDQGSAHWSGMLLEALFTRDREADDAFDAARSFALAGEDERAAELLRVAVRAGFSDAPRAWSDEGLVRAGIPEDALPRPT
jgi:Zn-dependent protease